MSLKTVHIVFLLASIALASACAYWAFEAYREQQSGGYLAGLVTAVTGAIALIAYGALFLRKLGVTR